MATEAMPRGNDWAGMSHIPYVDEMQIIRTPEIPGSRLAASDSEILNETLPWSTPNSPHGDRGSFFSHKGSEFSLEYLPDPMGVIEELNKIKVRFAFDDETGARKRRATIARSRDSTCSDVSPTNASTNAQHLPVIPNERMTIQNELLDRLEASVGLQDLSAYIPSAYDDGVPKLGVYTQEERIERINAYREKRKQRVFGKVRYVLRKRASEGRQRVKGRFAKEDSAGTDTTQEEGGQMLNESTSWLEKMSLGARRLSQGILKKQQQQQRPASPASLQTEDTMDADKQGSWSSWLLKKTRRKSSASAASNGSGGGPVILSAVHPNGLPGSPAAATAAIPTATTFDDQEMDEFIIEQLGEPDRKRLTSGSSAIFIPLTPMDDDDHVM